MVTDDGIVEEEDSESSRLYGSGRHWLSSRSFVRAIEQLP
jgi:hypothetical protein